MSDTILAISRSLRADIATLDTISHNVANTSTPGFRAERTTAGFQAQLDGGEAAAVTLDQRDGTVSSTGRSLDLALRGEGFFVVQHGEQTLLARSGSFRLDREGRLVTASGDLVLGEAGPIQLDSEAVRIDEQGQIWSGERALDKLRLVTAVNPWQLEPVGSALRYDGALGAFAGSVSQGEVEHSNVDVAQESIRLMELTRHVESVQRAISIYDKAMDTGINRLGEN